MPLPPFVIPRFNPREIPGLQAWYDAADSASITLDAGRVSQWSDKSGNARHATNTTSGSTQPSYSTAARNGLNVLRFAAASVQRLAVAGAGTFNFLHNGTESWIAAVSVYGTSSNPLASCALFGNNGQSSSNVGSMFYYDDRPYTYSTGNNALLTQVTPGGGQTNSIRLLTSDSTAPLSAYNNIATPQAMLVQEAVWHSGNTTASQRLRLRINGGSEIAANEVAGGVTTGNATFTMNIGANGNAGSPMEGDICELMFFNQLPTAAARDLIRRYLGSKWGVTVG
jgi:hypothetical protein